MSSTDLPDAIVAATTAFAVEMSAWAGAHPNCSLSAAEAAVLEAGRRALTAVLHGTLLATQRARTTTPVRCPSCHRVAQGRDWRSRQVLTTCGVLRWERPWATCVACARDFGAGDATLGITAADRRSAGVNALLVALGSAAAFAEAGRLLTLTTGLTVASETLRQVTEAAGSAVVAAQDAQVAAYESGREPPVTHPAPGVLVAETDGVMVRYLTGWHEVKIGLVGGWLADRGGKLRLQQLSYVAAREPSERFAWRWGADAARRGAVTVVGWHGAHQGVAELRQVVILGDGAVWIWGSAGAQFGERIEIVDNFHAAEHLTAVAGILYGAETPPAQAWAAARREDLLNQGVDAVLPQLHSATPLSAEAAAKLRTEQGYFRTNQARMQYPSFRAQGLPIGSGAVESSAKHLIQQRLKRAGARWSEPGAAALIALRADQATHLSLAA